MTNPLLERHALPPFSRIKPIHAEPAVRSLIERNKQKIEALLAATADYNWENLLSPIEEMEDELDQAWSSISHLNSVCNSSDWRDAYNACLPLLSGYRTWRDQHEVLCRAYQYIADSAWFASLDAARRKAVEDGLRDFRLSGVFLPPAQKKRYAEVRSRLSQLASKFGENVLDATTAWSKEVTREQLEGLPESALANARQAGEQRGCPGYLITLEYPSCMPVLTYCHDRELRREVYTAYCTRASDQGPHAGKWDNSGIIDETLALRHDLAQLLGFGNYAEFSLATKMAESTAQVMAFLRQLAEQSRPLGEEEWGALTAFARDKDALEHLEPWDVNYYSELLKQERYQVSQEEIRPYLPVNRVLPGLFEVARRLYGIEVAEVQEFDSYHDSVQLFEIRREGEVIAMFYLDLYSRAHKRGGAWMNDSRVRRRRGDQLQIPVAWLVCNFTPPVGNAPALLTHAELITLFHEFGHGLHHMLTRQTVAAVSGINGVAWDAVELPSQFLENWCWERDALSFISAHCDTGEPLPDDLLDKLLAARNFQAAMSMLRQLEFSLFDFRVHLEWGGDNFESVQGLLQEIRRQVAVNIPPPFNRFQHSFSHIFAGGYAAGYYSYKWAEVLSADAFSRFEDEGIFNPATGADFRTNILEQGGSRDEMSMFVAFRGRQPSIDPLLRHSGIR